MLPQLLTTFLDSATAFALPATLLASGVSTVVVAAGWRRRHELQRRQGQPLVAEPIELGQTTFAAGVLDVGSETTAVMRQFERLAAHRFVALELAVQPDLVVRTDPRALRQILGDLVSRAIEQSPCGRVLLAAAHVGGRVQITVSDDGRPPRSRLAGEPVAAGGTPRRLAGSHDGDRCSGRTGHHGCPAVACRCDQPTLRHRG